MDSGGGVGDLAIFDYSTGSSSSSSSSGSDEEEGEEGMMVVSEDEEGEKEEDEEDGENRVLTAQWRAKLEEKGKTQVLHRSLWKDVGGRKTMEKVYRDFVPRSVQGAAVENAE